MAYIKDTIFDNEKKHAIHIEPTIHELKKIIDIEGSQRILILLYEPILFTCAKAYDNTHYDIYNTLYYNKYIKYDYNSFNFLIETKKFFGGSILYNKDNLTQYDSTGALLYCKNFNLQVVDSAYTNIESAIEFYNLLPDILKDYIGELDINETKLNLNCMHNTIQRGIKDINAEKDLLLKQFLRYLTQIDELIANKPSLQLADTNTIRLCIKTMIALYQKYKKKY